MIYCCLTGHNFGSEHDPDTDECAPADTKAQGGKFIMYPASVSGQLPNNKVKKMYIYRPSLHRGHIIHRQ